MVEIKEFSLGKAMIEINSILFRIFSTGAIVLPSDPVKTNTILNSIKEHISVENNLPKEIVNDIVISLMFHKN